MMESPVALDPFAYFVASHESGQTDRLYSEPKSSSLASKKNFGQAKSAQRRVQREGRQDAERLPWHDKTALSVTPANLESDVFTDHPLGNG